MKGLDKDYSFMPSEEYIRDTMDLSTREKLIWLREANEFVKKFVPVEKLKLWERIRRSGL